MKNRWEGRKHTALGVVTWSKKFSRRCRLLLGGIGPPKFNQLHTVTTCTYRHSFLNIYARNFDLWW